jgi:hypothetical protein
MAAISQIMQAEKFAIPDTPDFKKARARRWAT